MTITYRLATHEDNETIYEFALKAIADSVLPAFAEDAAFDLQDRIMSEETKTLIALDGEDIVAYAELDLSRKGRVYIRGVYVLPKFRREGIGGTLLKMIKSEFCKNDERIHVKAYTPEGRHFWETLGFKVHHYNMELVE